MPDTAGGRNRLQALAEEDGETCEVDVGAVDLGRPLSRAAANEFNIA